MRVRAELRALLRLGGPLVVANLATMIGGVATTLMMGRLGAEAVGIQGLGGILFFNVAILGMDLLLGLDYPVAHAVGAGRLLDAHRYLVQGTWITLVAAGVATLIMRHALPLLAWWDLNPAILPHALDYVRVSSLGLVPLFFCAAAHRYLQARGLTRSVMAIMVGGLVVELVAKWALVFGHLGAPALGAIGAAWGAVFEFVFIGVATVAFLVWHEHVEPTGLWRVSPWPELRRAREVLRLGAPAALRSSMEVGVFAVATTLAARLDAASLAAHQITLNVAGLAFMVPLGLGAGAAARVGNLLGARDADGARYAGWTAIGIGLAFMFLPAMLLVAARSEILHAYTSEESVIALGLPLFLCAGAFQLFDGLQGVATGVLRGAADTRTPLVANFASHWGIGLPLGWMLCARAGLGVTGLWIGLSSGLVLVSVVLTAVWARRARRLVSDLPPAPRG